LRIHVAARLGEGDLVLRVDHLVDDDADLEQLDLADLRVPLCFDLLLRPVGALGRRQHRILQGFHDDPAVDPLLLAHLLGDSIQVRQHRRLLPHACTWRGPLAPGRRAPPGAGNSNSVLARSIPSRASDTIPASGSSTVIAESVAAVNTPWNWRRWPTGSCMRTRTRWPSARWKCCGRTSGRFRPGDEHSRW